jgi:hypothetical protein
MCFIFPIHVAGLSGMVRKAPAHTMYLAKSSWRVTQTLSALTRGDGGDTSTLTRTCSRAAIRGHHTAEERLP